MQDDRTARTMRSMLEEIDALPSPKRQASINHGNGQMSLRERRAYMCGHVVRPFHGVAIQRIVLRSNAFEEVAQVGNDIRIGVLLNRERRRCMLAEQREESSSDMAPGNPFDDRRSEIVEALARRSDIETRGELFHVYA